MKHYYRSLLTAVAAGLVLFTTSCTDEKETELNIQDIKGSASVEGKIVYEAGKSSDSASEQLSSLSNEVVYFYMDLKSLGESYKGKKVFTTTTDGSGKFNISLPANAKGIKYNIYVNSFTGQVWEKDTDGNYRQYPYWFTNEDVVGDITLLENLNQYKYIVLDDSEKIQD